MRLGGLVRRAIVGLLAVLAGCSVALAQGAAVAEPIPWAQVTAGLAAVATVIGALVKGVAQALGAFHRAIGALDARATAFEATVREGFAGGLVRLDRIEAEQRKSSDAAVASGVRLESIEREVESIHTRMDAPGPRKAQAATLAAGR